MADVNPDQQPDRNRCGEELSGWLLCPGLWTNLMEKPTTLGFFQKPDCSQSQIPRQLHPSASSALQETPHPGPPPFFFCLKADAGKLWFLAVRHFRSTTGAEQICLVWQRSVSGCWKVKFMLLL